MSKEDVSKGCRGGEVSKGSEGRGMSQGSKGDYEPGVQGGCEHGAGSGDTW